RRAPERIADRLREVPGVAHVETRVIASANLDVRGFDEPVTSVIVSLPDGGQPELNRLFVRSGRLPAPRSDEVVLNEVFAEAHDLVPGDSIRAIVNGRHRVLTVSGIALSPEYLMQIQPGAFFPDPERFGVLWMDRAVLGPAYDMEGAFNDVVFTVAPGARIADVVVRVDAILRPYGGPGAYGGRDHRSRSLLYGGSAQLDTQPPVPPLLPLPSPRLRAPPVRGAPRGRLHDRRGTARRAPGGARRSPPRARRGDASACTGGLSSDSRRAAWPAALLRSAHAHDHAQ